MHKPKTRMKCVSHNAARTLPIWTSICYLRILFFRIIQYNADAHNTHAHSPYEHIRKPYPYEHLWSIEHLTHMEIPEVTIGASLSMERRSA
jgi:hypothetical protein